MCDISPVREAATSKRDSIFRIYDTLMFFFLGYHGPIHERRENVLWIGSCGMSALVTLVTLYSTDI